MISAILDTNIYDLLADDEEQCERIRYLITRAHFRVVVTRTIAMELYSSPFNGIPDFFPWQYVGNTVGRAGMMSAGDSIGNGKIYDEHLGKSKKTNDALITDAAAFYADWLVSEDKRLYDRAKTINMRAKLMKYSDFRNSLIRVETGS